VPVIDELLHEHSLQSIRSDGSQMIALKTGQTENCSEWELLFVQKDGHVDNNGTLVLPDGEKAVLRKICNNEQLLKFATLRDFVEWRPCVLEERPDEQVFQLKEELSRAAHDMQEVKSHYELQLQEARTQYETVSKKLEDAQRQIQGLTILNTSQQKRERTTPRMDIKEIERHIKTTAAAIAERTPSETQKIIINQVELSAGFYQEVGVQSHDSFRLSLWLAAAGGVIFFLTIVAAILISWFRGDGTPITWIGTIAAVITEVLAAMNRLYNQASDQFAAFQVDLDRINRSAISYAMISEDAFEKKTPVQQEGIRKVTEALLQSSQAKH